LLDRDHLETFATVAEVGSFERAAGALNVTRGAVSQRIKALEQELATILLVREQPVRPTPAGEVLLRHVKALRMLEDTTLRELNAGRHAEKPVPVAIAVNPDSLATWFPQALWPSLRERRITLEVVVEDEDYTDARLARGEVVGCVSTEPAAGHGFLAEPLGAMEYRCYASPAFAREFFPEGLSVRNVANSPAILFDRKDSLHDEYLARRFGVAIDNYPRHYLPESATLIDAVAAGIGYGLVPSSQTGRLVAEGAIVELAPCEALHVHLYWHHWASEPPLAQEITTCIVASARAQLLQP
jgi:LysR family transcriptional regulator (chromosome initiation inhibitor)